MDKISTLGLLFILPTLLNAQLLNGSFENDNGSGSIAHWQNVCYTPQLFNDAAPGWGQKCIKQDYGNPQGCFPSFVYQVVPDMEDGEVWTVSGWAKVDTLWTPTNVGVFIGKVDDNNAVSTQNGAWTNNAEWTYISKTDTVHLQPNEVGAVVLMSATVPGPLYGYAYFDGIMAHDQISTSTNDLKPIDLELFPSPADDVLYLGHPSFGNSVNVQIYDLTGQVEQRAERIRSSNGTTLKLDVSTLKPGLHIVQVSVDKGVLTKRFYKK